MCKNMQPGLGGWFPDLNVALYAQVEPEKGDEVKLLHSQTIDRLLDPLPHVFLCDPAQAVEAAELGANLCDEQL